MLGAESPPAAVVATAPGLPTARPQPPAAERGVLPAATAGVKGNQGGAPRCPSRHGLASPLLQMGCYTKHSPLLLTHVNLPVQQLAGCFHRRRLG